MANDKLNKIDVGYVKKCLQANIPNSLTSYFFLLAKKMMLQGEHLEVLNPDCQIDQPLIPTEKQDKKY